MKRLMTIAGILAAAAAAGCGNNMNNNMYADSLVPPVDGTGGNVDGAPNGADSGNGADAGMNGGTDGGLGANATIFTIVLENHAYSGIVGNTTDAPYINSLIGKYGLATMYSDTGHPSLPNYLWMTSGQNPGPFSDYSPGQNGSPFSVPGLGGQLETAGIKWRAYMETMNSPCQTSNSTNYAARHNPFLYYTEIDPDPKNPSALCKKVDVAYSSFAADLAANTYRYMWITPNLINDGHDGTLQDSDNWCKSEIPKILASDGYKAGGVIFLTWDEAEGGGDHIPMIIISPRLKSAGITSSTAYDHSSYLASVEDLLGLPRLDTVKSSPNMLGDFLN